jgi:excinuclease ABC subunit A
VNAAGLPDNPSPHPLTNLNNVAKQRRKKPEAAAAPEPSSVGPVIQVRGARVHNLKNVHIDLPRDCLVVLTGVSGSGKSSLAFDTIYAEGQRRYLECLSSYARQFLDQLERPDVDSIEGLPPTVAIDQRAGTANPRSTLGTVTEIYDYLRLLFAKVGKPHCPTCGVPILRQTPEQMAAQLMRLKDGQKVQILAPLVRDRKGTHADVFQAIRRAGLIRARVDGELIEIGDQPPKLAKAKSHTIEAVVDRIAIREGIRPRLAESLDLALKLSEGGVVTLTDSPQGWVEQFFSIHLNCPNCGAGLPAIEPRSFSFNSPHGACPECQGLGSRWAFELGLAVPDRSRSWDQGAVVPWALLPAAVKDAADYDAQVNQFLKQHRVTGSSPLDTWPAKVWSLFWSGEPTGGFPGLAVLLEQVYEQSRSEPIRKALDAYRDEVLCTACGGSRLRPESRAVRVGDRSIADLTMLAIGDLLGFFQSFSIESGLEAVGAPLVVEIVGRLQYLVEVGLDYLSLGRGSDTLSGGELQRARLAAQLGSGLLGVCTILDEPTAGLHPRDTSRLITSIRRLLGQGNSVLVVEHDASMIRAADWLVDLGPGAGPDGGTVVAAGTLDEVLASPASITARYLTQGFELTAEPSQRLAASPGWIKIRGAALHNLKHVDARFPLAALTSVTGVSGSGKSTLIYDVLARNVRRLLNHPGTRGRDPEGIVGLEAIDQLVEVDQSPIGSGPRSTPATATGLFDEVRRVFALTREAKIRGYGYGRFSFNAKGGRCEACRGLGQRRLPMMHFLPDMHVTCEVCSGKRFNRQTLEVKFKGKSIGDVLEMRVDESRLLFEAVPRVLRRLNALHDVGLGYLTLGQSSSTLSGGEAQRIKLAAELGRAATGRALYLFDEPTTGLHFADIERLLKMLHRLADLGHTVVVIEHQLDVIASADWVIDMGPEGGEAGGQIVAMGPPVEISRNERSHTGRALREGVRASATEPVNPSAP